MITLIGVGHVFDIKENVTNLILARAPELVCVELDKYRYYALLNKTPREADSLIYSLLSKFQQQVAGKYGVEVGEEMIAAIKSAKQIGANLALIDIDATSTFMNMWSKISFPERIKLLVGVIGGLFVRKSRIEKELKNFEDNTDKYMDTFSKEFPTFKTELVDKRDKYMADRLREFDKKYTKIVAVIGDGHVLGMKKELADLNLEIIRLSELRTKKIPKPPQTTLKPTEGTGFSFTYRGD